MYDVYHDEFRINLWVSFFTQEEAIACMLNANNYRADTDPSWSRRSQDEKLDILDEDGWAVVDLTPERVKPKPTPKPKIKKVAAPAPARPPITSSAKPAPQKWSTEALSELIKLHHDGVDNKRIATILKNSGLRLDFNPGSVSDKLHDLRKAARL